MMSRRKFFGAMAGVAVMPAAALAKRQPAFDSVAVNEYLPGGVSADLHVVSVMDAAGRINEFVGYPPSAYRLTTGPWLYLEARSTEISKVIREDHQAEIVVVMDNSITDCEQWSLDACGIRIWGQRP